jgi:hypothetical protein
VVKKNIISKLHGRAEKEITRLYCQYFFVITVYHEKCKSLLIHLCKGLRRDLKVHKNENYFGFDFEFCTISLLVMHK